MVQGRRIRSTIDKNGFCDIFFKPGVGDNNDISVSSDIDDNNDIDDNSDMDDSSDNNDMDDNSDNNDMDDSSDNNDMDDNSDIDDDDDDYVHGFWFDIAVVFRIKLFMVEKKES